MIFYPIRTCALSTCTTEFQHGNGPCCCKKHFGKLRQERRKRKAAMTHEIRIRLQRHK